MNTTGKKFGGRTKGTPNKVSGKVREHLSSIIYDAIESLDLSCMTKSEKLKLIQLGLPYIITRAENIEPIEEQKFTIEIIDRLTDYSDKDLHNAITNNQP